MKAEAVSRRKGDMCSKVRRGGSNPFPHIWCQDAKGKSGDRNTDRCGAISAWESFFFSSFIHHITLFSQCGSPNESVISVFSYRKSLLFSVQYIWFFTPSHVMIHKTCLCSMRKKANQGNASLTAEWIEGLIKRGCNSPLLKGQITAMMAWPFLPAWTAELCIAQYDSKFIQVDRWSEETTGSLNSEAGDWSFKVTGNWIKSMGCFSSHFWHVPLNKLKYLF